MSLPVLRVIGYPVTALPCKAQIETIANWAKNRLSKVVCVANVHMLMEAHWHLDLDFVLQNADIVTPDGMPLVWMLRLMGVRKQDRVAGLDILTGVCELAQLQGIGIYFVGSEDKVLDRIKNRLNRDFPLLTIAGMEPLPFSPLTSIKDTSFEDKSLIDRINTSGAGIVLIALGCPKQEYWMAKHHNKIQAVMIGLGAAFSVYAGVYKRAPHWVRESGLEWLYRLMQEPHRLWKRYIMTIPPFIYLALRQVIRDQWLRSVRRQRGPVSPVPINLDSVEELP